MESQVESVDISSIKAAALQPRETSLAEYGDPSTNNRLKLIQQAFQHSVAATHLDKHQGIYSGHGVATSQAMNASQSLLDLPSTVPDSQAIANVDKILQDLPAATMPQVMDALKKLGSQGAPQDTQPLSPAFLESYISKSRRLHVNEQEAEYTHTTLQPGDEGHIDLISSRQQDGVVVGEYASQPIEIDFSPPQSAPSKVFHFPESQRFKTPATVEKKKRKYTPDVVESPTLPQNPFARVEEVRSGRMMGLSQAFAATQAVSSPYADGLPPELHSDRPSPALPVQLRPNIATDSSPILTRPLLPRSSTEPQTKYISVEESQAMRETRKKIELDGVEEEDSEDSFDETPAEVRWRREKKRRDEEAQRQFAAVASSRKAKGTMHSLDRSPGVTSPPSSPLPSQVPLPVVHYLHPPVTSPPDLLEDTNNASEEETDQEDDAVRHPRQVPLRSVLEEDKENTPQEAILIPETAALNRVMSEYAAGVEVSPSVRHGSAVARSQYASQRAEDEEPVVVANSQPSQTKGHVISGPKLSSSSGQTEFVPQSQYLSNSIPERDPKLGDMIEEDAQSPDQQILLAKPSLLVLKPDTRSTIAETTEETRLAAEVEGGDEDEEAPRRSLRKQGAPQTLSSTIPETSSARLRGGIPSLKDQHSEMSKSMSEFETAPTHLSAFSKEHDSAPAVLPLQASVFLSPRRSKRKRMIDIDAEESQPRSSGPDLGELNPMLMDREYGEIMGSSSPIRPGRFAKRRRLEASPLKPRQAVSSSLPTSSVHSRNHDSTVMDSPGEEEPRTIRGESSPASPDDVRAAVPRKKSLYHSNVLGSAAKQGATYGKRKSKPSAWDIQASPEKAAPVKFTTSTSSLRKRPSTLPPADMCRASTSRLPCAATQVPRASEGQGVTYPVSHQRRARARLRSKGHFDSSPEVITEAASIPLCEVSGDSARLADVVFPNQVLACYNGKARAYYPAACLGISAATTLRYQIQWEGYEPDEIDEHGVRSLDLRCGDNIKINIEGFPKIPHVIQGFRSKVGVGEDVVTDIRGYKTILVAPRHRKSLPASDRIGAEELKEVPVSAIYLDSNMWSQMRDRTFTYTRPPGLLSAARPGFSTPLERPSTPSTPDSRSRRLAASIALPAPASMPTKGGIFANMAFAISYDSPTRKSELTRLITSNGGLLLTLGFHQILQPDAMTLKPQFTNLSFTALLADKHSRKEKYLQALALGIPCLSGKWLEACVAGKALLNWQSYLLPAGESDELEGAVRSRVLPFYEPSSVRAADVIESRPNILTAEPVIFVLGRGKAEEKRRPYVFLTQALGAGHIEKVIDIRAAKVLLDEPDGKGYKWVFVDDRDVESASALLIKKSGRGIAEVAGVRVVGNEFVKQSLVLGRMFGG